MEHKAFLLLKQHYVEIIILRVSVSECNTKNTKTHVCSNLSEVMQVLSNKQNSLHQNSVMDIENLCLEVNMYVTVL